MYSDMLGRKYADAVRRSCQPTSPVRMKPTVVISQSGKPTKGGADYPGLYFFAALPLVALIGSPLAKLTHSDLPVHLILFLSFVAAAAAIAYVQNWKCPRCGKPFSRKRWYSNAYAVQCMHCKLPK